MTERWFLLADLHQGLMTDPPAAESVQVAPASGAPEAAPPAVSIPAPAPPPVAASSAPTGDVSDPLEPLNRTSYALNAVLDRLLFRPIAMTYRRVLPRPIRSGIHNAISNWDEPIVLVNDLVQVRLTDAAKSAGRFAINSTIGVAGVFDVASGQGLPHHDNGFTLTLGRYGVPSGPYLYLPAIGPSSVRDAAGNTVDLFTNPLTHLRHIRSRKVEIAQEVVSVVAARADVEGDLMTVRDTATDPYAFVRSVYQQHIQAQIMGDDVVLDAIPEVPATAPTRAEPAPAPSPATPEPPKSPTP